MLKHQIKLVQFHNTVRIPKLHSSSPLFFYAYVLGKTVSIPECGKDTMVNPLFLGFSVRYAESFVSIPQYGKDAIHGN